MNFGRKTRLLYVYIYILCIRGALEQTGNRRFVTRGHRLFARRANIEYRVIASIAPFLPLNDI